MNFYRYISLLAVLLIAQVAYAQVGEAYTVIANPGQDASTSIRLNWHTDENSPQRVCHYTSTDDTSWANVKTVAASQELCTVFDSIYSKSSTGADIYEDARFMRNTVEINALTPDTRYMYRIDDSNTIRYFKTAPTDNNWTAAVISDFHAYAPLPARTSAAMNMLSTLEQQRGEFDMVLHVGDIIAWGGSYSFWKSLYENSPFKKYVWAGVNGNHDNMSRGYALQTNQFFANTNNNPLNGYDGEMGVCYHFTYGNTLFIMLNNENMTSSSGLNKAQKWVREVIANNPARFIVVMEHYQWFYGTSCQTSQYERWYKLFDECGVDLAIAANDHIYARSNALYDGNETDGTRGTVYVQTPSSDNDRGQEMQKWTDNHNIIQYRWSEGVKTVGALLLTATNNSLIVSLHDRKGNTLDTIVVKSKR